MTIAEKFRIKPGYRLLTLHAPDHFKKAFGSLPEGVKISDRGKIADQVHWFVQNQVQLKKELAKIMALLQPGVVVWVYYPKASSKIQTDLTRDKGWDCLLSEKEKLTWLTLLSFDETWSAFGFRAKTETDHKKDARAPKEREIFKWADSKTKKVILPPELAAAFKKHKKEADYFHSLAFSHRREYVEWIVTAKKEETKAKRIAGTIEKLRKMKNNS